MKFEFDTLIDRTGTGASKWEGRTDEERQLGIVPMSVADMELPVAPCVREAAVRAAQHGIYGYTSPDAPYFDAVIGWMRARHGVALMPENIVPVSGVVPAISIAIRAFTQPGDGIIVQPPVYHPFYSTVELNGRRVERCPLALNSDRYHMDYAALEQAASKPDVKLMLLCSPHNPVGRVWTREELLQLFEICKRNNVLVLADEIHGDLVKAGRHTSFPTLSPDTAQHSLTFTAPSKTFNVPGLQNANALIFDPSLRERFQLQSSTDGFDNISYFGHAVSIAAYNEGAPWLDAVLPYIDGNYALLDAFLKAHMPRVRLFPMEGTYLAWVDFSGLGLDASALKAFLRDEAHLILNDGAMFGEEGAGFARFNLALPRQELQKALDRLAEAYLRI